MQSPTGHKILNCDRPQGCVRTRLGHTQTVCHGFLILFLGLFDVLFDAEATKDFDLLERDS